MAAKNLNKYLIFLSPLKIVLFPFHRFKKNSRQPTFWLSSIPSHLALSRTDDFQKPFLGCTKNIGVGFELLDPVLDFLRCSLPSQHTRRELGESILAVILLIQCCIFLNVSVQRTCLIFHIFCSGHLQLLGFVFLFLF